MGRGLLGLGGATLAPRTLRTAGGVAPLALADTPAGAPTPLPLTPASLRGPHLPTRSSGPCSSGPAPLGPSRHPSGPLTGSPPPPASLGDLVRDWHRGAQAVARGDWGCALRFFSDMGRCFNMGCVHLLAGHSEAALQVRLRCEGAASQVPQI